MEHVRVSSHVLDGANACNVIVSSGKLKLAFLQGTHIT